MAYNTNKTSETQLEMVKMFKEQSDKVIEEQKNPHFAEDLFNLVQNKNRETPPD